MDSLLTASLWALLSTVFFQFVSTAQANIYAEPGQNQKGRNPEEKPFSNINLHVAPPEPFPSWASALLVLVLIGAAAGLLSNCRHCFMSVQQVDSGEESILLSCRTTVTLPEDARVEWRDSRNRRVNVYENGSDHPGELDKRYKDRTKMNKDLLRTGDLSLTLEHPTDEDTNIYTCIVFSGDGNILMKKQIDLQVKVHQVEVEEGAESVLLPFTTTSGLPGDAGVFWWDKDSSRVHLFENGSDQDEDQNQLYRNRTKMEDSALRSGDLSLILMYPTEEDSGEYRCRVRKSGELLRAKNIQLTVKGWDQDQNRLKGIRTRTNYIDPTPLMGEQSV